MLHYEYTVEVILLLALSPYLHRFVLNMQVLCRLHGFRDGLVFLYDKLRLHREVLQVICEAYQILKVVSVYARLRLSYLVVLFTSGIIYHPPDLSSSESS